MHYICAMILFIQTLALYKSFTYLHCHFVLVQVECQLPMAAGARVLYALGMLAIAVYLYSPGGSVRENVTFLHNN